LISRKMTPQLARSHARCVGKDLQKLILRSSNTAQCVEILII
jgi:hypothetical protein